MPLLVTLEKLADGRPYVRTVSSGVVTGDDARALMSRLAPGAEFEGLHMLSVMSGSVDITPDARKLFTTLNRGGVAKPMKVAIVTPNAPLRVMLSFILRIAGQASDTKFFPNEANALAWLGSV